MKPVVKTKPSSEKKTVIGVSLNSSVREWVIARATQGNLPVSAYVATLIDGDQRLNLLPEILQSRLEEPAKKGGRP